MGPRIESAVIASGGLYAWLKMRSARCRLMKARRANAWRRRAIASPRCPCRGNEKLCAISAGRHDLPIVNVEATSSTTVCGPSFPVERAYRHHRNQLTRRKSPRLASLYNASHRESSYFTTARPRQCPHAHRLSWRQPSYAHARHLRMVKQSAGQNTAPKLHQSRRIGEVNKRRAIKSRGDRGPSALAWRRARPSAMARHHHHAVRACLLAAEVAARASAPAAAITGALPAWRGM